MLYSTLMAWAGTEARGSAWSNATPQLNPKSQKFCLSILSLSNQTPPLPRQTNAFWKLQPISCVHRAQASEEELLIQRSSFRERYEHPYASTGRDSQSRARSCEWNGIWVKSGLFLPVKLLRCCWDDISFVLTGGTGPNPDRGWARGTPVHC